MVSAVVMRLWNKTRMALTNRVNTTSLLFKYVNVNVHLYGPDSPLSSITSLLLERTLLWSHLLEGELSAFSAVGANHYNARFCATQYSLLLGWWTETSWNEKLGSYFYTCPALVIEPQTFWSLVQCPIRRTIWSPTSTYMTA